MIFEPPGHLSQDITTDNMAKMQEQYLDRIDEINKAKDAELDRANGWINQEIIIRGATNKACLNLYYSGGGNVCGDPTCGYLCINPLNYNSGYSNQYYNNNVPNNPFTPFINSLSH